ncbi:hypothetical protein CCP3SC5AM1_720021 [Gammaproteobacteria bacterium]
MATFMDLVEVQDTGNLDSTVRSDIATKRAGYTFLRISANSWNDSGNGADKQFVFGGTAPLKAIKPLFNGAVLPVINCYGSLGSEIVTESPLVSPRFVSDPSNNGWVEVVFKGGNIDVTGIVLTAAPISYVRRNIRSWKVEIMNESDAAWRLLGNGQFTLNQFVSSISNTQIAFASNELGTSAFTIGYKPVIDYTGQLPITPSRLSAKVMSMTEIALKWTGNSDDKRATSYVVYRKDPGSNSFNSVGGTDGVVIDPKAAVLMYKNVTNFTDTIPSSATSKTYNYYVVASNDVGESVPSGEISVSSLTQEEFELLNINNKITSNNPLTLSEGCSYILGSLADGSKAADMIKNRTASYDNFKSSGLTSGQALSLSVLYLTTRDEASLLHEQFVRAQAMLGANSTAMAQFIDWAKTNLSFNVENMLSAADTVNDQTLVLNWMRNNGYLT